MDRPLQTAYIGADITESTAMIRATRWVLGGSCVVALAACATSSTSTTGEALDRTCTVSDCFYQRDVRDFEVIDDTTLIVYVGPQRCAFHLELSGTFCDMTMAPDLYFRTEPQRARILQSGRDDAFSNRPSRSALPEAEIRRQEAERNLASTRICANDFAEVDGGVFTEVFEDPTAIRQSQCRITNVTSMTDDQLVELYVDLGVAPPPPPVGPGRIAVGEEEAPPETTAPATDTPAEDAP